MKSEDKNHHIKQFFQLGFVILIGMVMCHDHGHIHGHGQHHSTPGHQHGHNHLHKRDADAHYPGHGYHGFHG